MEFQNLLRVDLNTIAKEVAPIHHEQTVANKPFKPIQRTFTRPYLDPERICTTCSVWVLSQFTYFWRLLA